MADRNDNYLSSKTEQYCRKLSQHIILTLNGDTHDQIGIIKYLRKLDDITVTSKDIKSTSIDELLKRLIRLERTDKYVVELTTLLLQKWGRLEEKEAESEKQEKLKDQSEKRVKRISEEGPSIINNNQPKSTKRSKEPKAPKEPKEPKESPYDEFFQKNFHKWQGTEARKKYFYTCLLCQKEMRGDKRKQHLNTVHPEKAINKPFF